MADFSFRLSPYAMLGADVVNRLATVVNRQATRAILVSDPSLHEGKITDRVIGLLQEGGVSVLPFDEIPPFSGSKVAEAIAELARGSKAQVVLGMGGIKTMSLARVAAAAATTERSIDDIMDRGIAERSIPFISIPSAMRDPFMLSPNVIITDSRNRSPKMISLPDDSLKAVFIDPVLFNSVTGKLAAALAFDSLLGAIEAFISTKSNFYSDTVLENAIRLLSLALNKIQGQEDGFSISTLMAEGSFLAACGIAASSIGLGTSISFTLNARYKVSKCWLSPILLPYILEEAIKSRVEKVARIAELMGEETATLKTIDAATKAVDTIRSRLGSLKLPSRLKDFDLQLDRMVEVSQMTRDLEPVSYLPRILSVEDIYDILKQAF